MAAAVTSLMALLPGVVRSQDSTRTRIHVVRPALDLTWTSGAPDARGDGAAMSGVGLDLMLSAGAQGSLGPLRFSFVPELAVNGNRGHQTFASGDPTRNTFASPFYFGDFSADLPSRPGEGVLVRPALGESGIWWTGRRAFIGVLGSTPDWGPGGRVRSANGTRALGEGLVLGHSAPGVPRLELAFAWRPGSARGPEAATDQENVFRLRWFSGVVRESDWFDADPGNSTRMLSGARVEFERERWLSVGAARTVMSASGRGTLAAAAQPFTRTRTDSVIELLSADLLVDFRDAGTTAWLEAARQAPFRGVGSFLRFPTEGIAFRTGLTQRLRQSATAEWSVSLEAVRLDQSGTSTDAVPNDLYTSPTVTHGWTHLGQSLGSGIGPGGQQQIARLDRAGRIWRLGAFAERVRRNEDAMFRQVAPASDRHDVTLQAGLVAARRIGGYDVAMRLSGGKRLDYLFQGASSTPGGEPVDLTVVRAGVSFTPVAAARRIVEVLTEP